MTQPETETTDQTEVARLHDEILGGKAEIAKLRDLLGKENQRANDAITREETAEQATLEAEQERDQARDAALREAAAALQAQARHLTGEFNDSDVLHEDGPAATVATWKRAADKVLDMTSRAATDQTAPELTAEEARDLADELSTELYRAQDALAFVEECCVIADREGRQPTTADVREWLKGARCGRQLLADAQEKTALRDRIAETLADADGWKWAPGFKDQSPTWQGYQTRADAVLAVLPASVDRADVLREEVDRAALSAKLWEIAEQHIVAEWICCEPLEPGHTLCAKGYAALGMAKTLLVDSPGAWNPEAPLLNAVLALLPAIPNQTHPVTAIELAHALDNSTPYPIELDRRLCDFMAARLLEMLTISKRPEHAVWQPEEEPEPGEQPQPEDPAVVVRRATDETQGEAQLAPAAIRATVLDEAAGIAEDVALKRHRQHEIEREQGALDVMTVLRQAAGEARFVAEHQRELVHGCPPDGSGLTPCCGRTPFELPRGDRISSEAPVTCPGPDVPPAGGVRQPSEARRCAHNDLVYGRCILPLPGHNDRECFHERQPIRIDEETDEDSLCGSEYPGDDNFVGQLCGLPMDHFGDHRSDEALAGTGHTALLRWPNAQQPKEA
jgi:hypothetical protein